MKFIILFLLPFIVYAQQYGTWSEIESLNHPRLAPSVVLNNGNVLIAGNDTADSTANASCEIFDINTGQWRNTAPMNVARWEHQLVLLDNGEVLAFGGGTGRSCEIFNPITEQWRMTDSIPNDRNLGGEAFVKLLDGRVMVIGGENTLWDSNPATIYKKCDIYDPATGHWTEAADMLKARIYHSATVMQNGNVLVSSGFNHVNKNFKNCEIYKTNSNTWTETDTLNVAREAHSQIILNNGDILLLGGTSRDSSGNATPENQCLLYNFQTNKWQIVGALAAYRNSQAVFWINNKDLIIISSEPNRESWEIYDTENFESVYYKIFPNALMLNNGNTVQLKNSNILVAGGLEYTTTGFPIMWRSKRSFEFDITTGIKDGSVETPRFFKLFQNYPNPFNPTTKIRFQLPKNSRTKLIVYDALGNEVQTILNKNLGRGNYEFIWNGTDNTGAVQPSGVYFIRLFSSNFQAVIKALLIK